LTEFIIEERTAMVAEWVDKGWTVDKHTWKAKCLG